jgi:ribosomal protein S18 acetylase RimI-like enzyme
MEIHRALSAREPEFDELVRIYTEALPASERKSEEALRRMIERPEYVFLAALDAGAVVGFALAIAFIDSDAALLEYLAVDRERRGMGIGGSLFRAAVAWNGLCSRYLLVEVESEAARAKRFYRQLGARQIEGLAHQMPQVSNAEPPLMDMLVYRDELPDSIDKARLRGWIAACYGQVYGVAESDPRIGAMLNGLPNTLRLI